MGNFCLMKSYSVLILDSPFIHAAMLKGNFKTKHVYGVFIGYIFIAVPFFINTLPTFKIFRKTQKDFIRTIRLIIAD